MHHRSRTTILAAAVLAAAVSVTATPASAQNLLTNPGFETGDFSGWTIGPQPSYADPQVLADGVPLSADEFSNVRGGSFAAVTGEGKGLSLAQTVTVLPNTTYEFGGWLSITLNALLFTNLTLDDTSGNAVSPFVQLSGGTTSQDFTPFRRLYTTGPQQTSATLRLRTTVSPLRPSLDDLLVQPWSAPLSPAQQTDKLLTAGQPSPDAIDTITALHGNSHLNNALHAATASVSSGTTASFARAASGQVSALRGGWPSPEGNGTVVGSDVKGINEAGQALVSADLTGSATEGLGLYVVQGASRTTVLRLGQTAPGGGTFSSFGPAALSESGGAAVLARAQTIAQGIYFKPAGQPLLKIARDGEPAPRGGNFASISSTFALNGDNRLAFKSSLSSGQSGLFRYDGAALQTIALGSDAAPGGGIYSGFSDPDINAAGRVAFASSTILGMQGLYVTDEATTVTRRLGQGEPAPGGSSFASIQPPVINESAQIAFIATLADGGSGVYRSNADGTTTRIARTGQPRPDAAGNFANFAAGQVSGTGLPPVRPSIAALGQVAFVDFDKDRPGEPGIYLGDGSEVIHVARWGYAVNGQVLTQIGLGTDPQIPLNDFGQVAYFATFADGQTSNVLFTPTLRWRSNQSGNWSNSNNWTVGLAPAAVHPVVIDSPAGVNVTTPAGSTAVLFLKVGASNFLTLSPGSDLTAAEGVTIDAGAFLKGSGTITGDLTNAGTIAPGNSIGTITLVGDYTQTGRLDLELLGGEFDLLAASGTVTLGGDIYVTGSVEPGQEFNVITASGGITGSAIWHLPAESSVKLIALTSGGQAMQITYLPEPASLALLALAGFAPRRSRRL